MTKEITLNHITKIEGHAKLKIGIDKGKITTCELSSVEGSRYFEGLVKGRKYFEAHEMTSRICGICSCAHVVAATQAIEEALGYTPTEQTTKLRILLTLAERIRSHATHLYFLALPDLLGYESAIAMAPKFREELKTALHIMKIGNKIIKILGGRDIHPVSATVGGWLKLPEQSELNQIYEDLEKIKDAANKTVTLFSSLKIPKFESDGNYFALNNGKEYCVLSGDFSSKDNSFNKYQYRKFITESHKSRSTANFVVKEDHRYMVGALSRLNLNSSFLSFDASKALKKSGLKLHCKNPFANNLAQAIEIVHCVDHAMNICSTTKIQKEPIAQIEIRAGTGVGCIEVPRGVLWHEYTLNNKGVITNANIITPTAQNLLNIQEDIREYLPSILDKSRKEIILCVEKLIRSYDPCFSCSAHFLEVTWI